MIKRKIMIVASLAAVVLVTGSGWVAAEELNALTAAEKKAGWKLLFDGQTTKGWRNYQAKGVSDGWKVVDGALTRAGKGA